MKWIWYKLKNGPRRGELRPALVVRENEDGTVNLQVMTDSSNINCSNDVLPCPYWVQGYKLEEPVE